MQSWAAEELKHVDLKDGRLNKRLVKLVEDLSSRPESSVPQACKIWAAIKGAYNFWSNPKVTRQRILESHKESTIERIEAERDKGRATVINIQDTTDINLSHHPRTKGLGPIDQSSNMGMKVHSNLVVSQEGVPQGLIYQESWVRDSEKKGKKHKRKKLETKDKESQRWLSSLKESQAAIPSDVKVITVADREGDIYDLFAMKRREGSELLIRVVQNRLVEHEGKTKHLWDAVKESPVLGEVTVELGRKGGQPSRKANLIIRVAQVSILPPKNRSGRKDLPSIPVSLILAEEYGAPPGVKPVCWLLLATFLVLTFQEAIECVKYYSYRWLIERYHFVLKSGCGLEELQLESADNVQRALGTYCIVAWRLLWLTYEARLHPDSPCDRVLQTHEWQSLYCFTHKASVAPLTPPSLHDAVLWIAKLGGFIGRKGDGEPGVKTIWRGLRSLSDISSSWKLFRDTGENYLTNKRKTGT